jgi:diguanylate cyclase (GGDEF)-like protein
MHDTITGVQSTNQPIRVILVEDNRADAHLVHEWLGQSTEQTFSVTHAKTLEDAVRCLPNTHADAIVLDLSLPDANGLETIRVLRAAAPMLPVVVLSGAEDMQLALRAVQLGAQDYLVKGHGEGDSLCRALRYAIERKRIEERLNYLATHDSLTDLPNRFLLLEHLPQALVHATRHQRKVAVMMLDLDNFKYVNDNFGHAAGDRLLVAVADRLRGCLRDDDVVARLGGDEFCIVAYDMARTEDIAPLMEKIYGALQEPVAHGAGLMSLSASIGICTFPENGGDADTLLRHADHALYRAKADGKNSYRFFSPH